MTSALPIPSILARMGLSETDADVYAAVLAMGRATVGEIVIATDLQLVEVLQSVKQLASIGYLRTIGGVVPRYHTALPFLPTFIGLEKEFIYRLDSLVKAVKNDVDNSSHVLGSLKKRLDSGTTDAVDLSAEGEAVSQLASLATVHALEAIVRGEQAIGELKGHLAEGLKKVEQQLESLPESLSEKVRSYVDAAQDAIVAQIADRSSQDKNSASTLATDIAMKLEELKSTVLDFAQEQRQYHADLSSKLPDEFATAIEKYSGYFGSKQEEFLSQLKRFIAAVSTELTRISAEGSEKLVEASERLTNKNLTLLVRAKDIGRNSMTLLTKAADQLSELSGQMDAGGPFRKMSRADIVLKINSIVEELRVDAATQSTRNEDIHKQARVDMESEKVRLQAELANFHFDLTNSVSEVYHSARDNADDLFSTISDDQTAEILAAIRAFADDTRAHWEESSQEINMALAEVLPKVVNEVEETYFSKLVDATQSIYEHHQEMVTNATAIADRAEEVGEALKEEVHKATAYPVSEQRQSVEEAEETLADLRGNLASRADELTGFLSSNVKQIEEQFASGLYSEAHELVEKSDVTITHGFRTLMEKLVALKAMVEAQRNDLREIAKMADSYAVSDKMETWMTVGRAAAVVSIEYLAEVAKSRAKLVTPRLSSRLVEVLRKIKHTVRIDLYTNAKRVKDPSLIDDLRSFRNVRLFHYPDAEYVAGVRDGEEEAILAQVKGAEHPIAIHTTNPKMVSLLQGIIDQQVARNSSLFD